MPKQLRRTLYATAGVLLIPVGLGNLPKAYACSCPPDWSIEDQLAAADVVFDGIATNRSAGTPTGLDPITWRFDVTNVVKGTATDPQDVVTPPDSSSCGVTFDPGRHYRILARRDGEQLSTHLCSGNRLLTGYRMAAADGGVFTFGASTFHGSAGGLRLNAPVVGITSTPSGGGYWLVASDGGVFSYGDAGFFGSAGGSPLNARVVGITSTPTGGGYWLVAADGGVFAYGDARFFGSTGGQRLNASVVGIAATGSGAGYWLLGADGGIFAYGDAGYLGRTASSRANAAAGITTTHSGTGYWIAGRFGDLAGFGDTSPLAPQQPPAPPSPAAVVGVARTSATPALVLASADGHVYSYGGSWFGDLASTTLNAPVVAVSA